jgi:hypothetical protein
MAASVTPNGSVGVELAVTSNACPKCAAEEHAACAWCGKCPGEPGTRRVGPLLVRTPKPRGDRRYCSSTCQVRAWQYRHSPEGIAEREAWEASERGQALHAMADALRAMRGDREGPTWKPLTAADLSALDVPALRRDAAYHSGPAERADHERRRVALDTLGRLAVTAARTADVCGTCGARLYPSETVYRAAANPESGPDLRGIVYPSCFACRCRSATHAKYARFCDECRWTSRSWARWYPERVYCKQAGPDHGGPYCGTCHPRSWHPARPCDGCGRPVVNHQSVRPGYRRDGGYVLTPDYAKPDTWRVFCSERCRRSVFHAEQKAKREHEPIVCPVCRERVDARRRDARYCSPACRQHAYRARHEPEPAL